MNKNLLYFLAFILGVSCGLLFKLFGLNPKPLTTDNTITLLGYALAAVGSILAYKQWTDDRKWKQREVLRGLIASLNETPGSRNAMMMLSSSDRDIPLLDAEEPADRYVRVTWRNVAESLIPEDLMRHRYNNKEEAIRNSFEDFLGRLNHIEHYLESNLLNVKDIKPFVEIWGQKFKCLSEEPHLHRNLKLYIAWRDLKGVQNLFARFADGDYIDLTSGIKADRDTIKEEIAEGKWSISSFND